MTGMEFGVTQIGGNERSAVQQGIDAEAWGYAVYWAPEFLAIPTLEPFAVLSAAAQHTKTIRLGTGVAGLALRSPIQLAKAAVTTDILSDGRLVLGLGLGESFPRTWRSKVSPTSGSGAESPTNASKSSTDSSPRSPSPIPATTTSSRTSPSPPTPSRNHTYPSGSGPDGRER